MIPVRAPVLTLSLAGAAALVYIAGPLNATLVYDRVAIGQGELWRLVTGQLVHFSTAHLVYNLVALLVAGAIVEVRRDGRAAVLLPMAAVAIGVTLYLGDPSLRFYGGLSGLVTATVVYLCLYGLRDAGAWRWICAFVLVGVAAKLAVELLLQGSLVPHPAPREFALVPLSHVAGAVTALTWYACEAISVRVRVMARLQKAGSSER